MKPALLKAILYMFYSCYRSNAEPALPASVLDRESSAGKQKNKPVMFLAALYNFLVGPTELSLEVLLNSKNTILPIVRAVLRII